MNIYTMNDWAIDNHFNALPGQEIEEQIYFEMRDVMPIASLTYSAFGCKIGFLSLEPAGHVYGYPVYMAFGQKGDKYYYLGLQPKKRISKEMRKGRKMYD